MSEDDDIVNIEWKKPGFGSAERVTLKTNIQKANKYNARKKRDANAAGLAPSPMAINKMRKKIKDIMDDDEDEDENDYQTIDYQNPLLNALNEDEMQMLRLKDERERNRIARNTGQMHAVLFLNRFIKDAGLKSLNINTLNKFVDNQSLNNADVMKNAIKDDTAKKAKIKWDNMSDIELIEFLRGVKKIHTVGGEGSIENMKIKDIIEAGKEHSDEQRIAKLILKKTGRTKSLEAKIKKKNLTKLKNKEKKVPVLKEVFREH